MKSEIGPNGNLSYIPVSRCNEVMFLTEEDAMIK